jgi:hypothetical protein
MRFGIMAMQTGALLPAGLSPQEAMAHVASFDHAAHVHHLAARPFDFTAFRSGCCCPAWMIAQGIHR